MTDKEIKIEFLNKLSDIISQKASISTSSVSVKKLFKMYLKTQNYELIIWDDNNMLLKDFLTGIKISDDETSSVINNTYTRLSTCDGNKFYFNEEEFDITKLSEEFYEIEKLKTDTNTVIFPLISEGDVFGLLKLSFSENEITQNLFSVINVAAKLISGAIINHILKEQMEISLNFYKAMKDIAKIIESQYELSYIIPLIGEMIDRFMHSHLIYIFLYRNNEYKLVWPRACKDETVKSILNKINIKNEYVISEDSKIAAFPLLNGENLFGAIVAYDNIEKLFQKDIDYLVQLTKQSELTIQRANSYAEILKYATMDALTGLNNRRQFEIRLNQELANSKRNKIPLCCMMIDVDYFKKVNDTYGHSAGDCVLKNTSKIIQEELREYDIACRFGGEEFFVILPRTKMPEAASVAQRLRKAIENTKIDLSDTGYHNTKYINITVSIGVCEYDNISDSNTLIQKTDKALYTAKESGRNKVVAG